MSPRKLASGKSVQRKDQFQNELSYSETSDSPELKGLSEFIQIIGSDHDLAGKTIDFYFSSIKEESQYRRESDSKARDRLLKEHGKANNYRFFTYVLTCVVLVLGIAAIIYMANKGIQNPAPYITIGVIITGSSISTVWRLFQKNIEV